MTTLALEEKTHTYRKGNRILPSVTGVIGENDFWFLPPGEREFYLERGTAVHRACALLNGQKPGHTVNWATLDSRIKPFVRAYESWLNDYDVKVRAVETPIEHPAYHYAGTPDADGTVKGRPALWDTKTGPTPHPKEALQTAAYASALLAQMKVDPAFGSAFLEWHGKKAVKHLRRYSIHLCENEKYVVKEWMDYEGDLAVFLCYLTRHNWLKKVKLWKEKADEN